MQYNIKHSTLENYKKTLLAHGLSKDLINELSPQVIKSRALKLQYGQKPGEGYISPIIEKAIEECKKDFQIKDFGSFDNSKDTHFLINKIRELKGVNIKYNFDIKKMKVNF